MNKKSLASLLPHSTLLNVEGGCARLRSFKRTTLLVRRAVHGYPTRVGGSPSAHLGFSRLLRLMCLLLLAALSGCATTASVTINSQFPEVLSDPRPIHAAVVFAEDFRKYIATPNDKTKIGIGSAQVQLLTNAFEGLFQRVDVVASRDELQPGTELIIVPSVREVQVSVPSESYLNVYEVWIKYNLEMETPEGVAIDSWFLPAYGKTPDSMMLSRTNAIEQATIVALRDAGAKLLLDFYRIPAVHGWLEQRETP